jgi:hypothetical protein
VNHEQWSKGVHIVASRTEEADIRFVIVMGATGPRLVMRVGDKAVVMASKWKTYTTDHGVKQLTDTMAEGLKALSESGQ